MIVNELFGFSKRNKDAGTYTNNPYAVMSAPPAAQEPVKEPEIDEPAIDEPAAAPSSMSNMARQLDARGQAQTSTGGATIATGRGVRHAASPLNPNQPVYPSAAKPAAKSAASPSLELMKKATKSLQGGPALSAQELTQVNDYRASQGAKPIPATTPTVSSAPAGFNATNVMKMPGMEKYAKPATPAKTPNFAGPSGYGAVNTSFKPPALAKRPQVAESLTWSKNFDPGMTLLRKMRK